MTTTGLKIAPVDNSAVRKWEESWGAIRPGTVRRIAAVLFLVCVFAGFFHTPGATAATGKKVPSICETGYRGQPEYDRKCLTRGTPKNAALMWFRFGNGGTDLGERLTRAERKSQCLNARGANGKIRAGIRDMFTDVAYDSYRNYRTVLTYVVVIGAADCRKSFGIK